MVRSRLLCLASVVPLLLVGLALHPAGAGAQLAAQRVAAGKSGTTLTLTQDPSLVSWDAVADSNGTTYLAWISAEAGEGRFVHLCQIPSGATGCEKSSSISPGAGGGSSASGLRLLRLGTTVVAVWFHDTVSGPGKIATSTVSGGLLGAAVDVADAPAFGGLYDATLGPDGTIHAVTWGDSGDTIQMHEIGIGGSTSAAKDPTFLVGQARIAIHDGVQPVVVLDQLGGFDKPVKVMVRGQTGTWGGISNVAGNWSLQGAWDLETAQDGAVRLVASVPNADYYPRITRWQGNGFGAWTSTGYRGACQFNTHDLHADASGRLADVFHACGRVRMFNQPNAASSATASFADTRTPLTGNSFSDRRPQIATTPRGTGWVLWGVDDPGNKLLATRVRLPGQSRTVSTSSTYGRVTLRGPVSCLPASDFAAAVSATRKNGWSIASKQLRLDGVVTGSTLDGGALAAGSNHQLVGRVTYRKNGQNRVVTATINFTACANPSAF